MNGPVNVIALGATTAHQRAPAAASSTTVTTTVTTATTTTVQYDTGRLQLDPLWHAAAAEIATRKIAPALVRNPPGSPHRITISLGGVDDFKTLREKPPPPSQMPRGDAQGRSSKRPGPQQPAPVDPFGGPAPDPFPNALDPFAGFEAPGAGPPDDLEGEEEGEGVPTEREGSVSTDSVSAKVLGGFAGVHAPRPQRRPKNRRVD